MTAGTISTDWNQNFRRKLTRWYRANHRPLPWRETSDAYAIWVSETMLQQTQVATVIGYYHRFLKRFPDVASLAQADEQSVLELWQGLGYYRRARQLHAAAKRMAAQFGSVFPSRFDDILSLPGVGRYTAGAVASFAFDTRAPILEANTIRLFSRLLALRESPQSAPAQKRLWEFAEAILPKRSGSGLLNQAAMELGSLICTPQNPACGGCPLNNLCPTHAQGLEELIPVAAPKRAVTEKIHVGVVIRNGKDVLLRQNPRGQWWHGLWDFPRIDLDANQLTGHFKSEAPGSSDNLEIVKRGLLESLELDCTPVRHLTTIKHGVTRYRIACFCFEATMRGRALHHLPGSWRWAGEQSDLPLSSPARRLKSWAHQHLE